MLKNLFYLATEHFWFATNVDENTAKEQSCVFMRAGNDWPPMQSPLI